jgi:hypothetical protein
MGQLLILLIVQCKIGHLWMFLKMAGPQNHPSCWQFSKRKTHDLRAIHWESPLHTFVKIIYIYVKYYNNIYIYYIYVKYIIYIIYYIILYYIRILIYIIYIYWYMPKYGIGMQPPSTCTSPWRSSEFPAPRQKERSPKLFVA